MDGGHVFFRFPSHASGHLSTSDFPSLPLLADGIALAPRSSHSPRRAHRRRRQRPRGPRCDSRVVPVRSKSRLKDSGFAYRLPPSLCGRPFDWPFVFILSAAHWTRTDAAERRAPRRAGPAAADR
jgi:hypothetical protein